MPKKPAKKSKQKSKKKKAKKGKTDETGLTKKEETILDVWKLMDENPLFNGMAKPTVDYIDYALKQQPLLKAMSPTASLTILSITVDLPDSASPVIKI